MKKLMYLASAFLIVFAVACKKDKKETNVESEESKVQTSVETKSSTTTSTSDSERKKITLSLESRSNSTATGNVVFSESNGIVSMIAVLDGLTEGTHAIHLHDKSDCSSADGTSTGGHWNPTAKPHGKWGDEKGYHKGDIGNFTANASGKGTVTHITNEWCIGCGDPSKDIIGKAVVVHQGTDDFTSQPSGAAGSRVSCGGIIE